MSRLYYNLKSSIGEAARLDYICFHNPLLQLNIYVSCKGDHNWGVNDGVFDGRWKDLETWVENSDGTIVHDFADASLNDLELIKSSIPVEVMFEVDAESYDEYYTAKDLNISIEIGDNKYDNKYNNHISVMVMG